MKNNICRPQYQHNIIVCSLCDNVTALKCAICEHTVLFVQFVQCVQFVNSSAQFVNTQKHTEGVNAKKMQSTKCTENGVFNLNLRGILILHNQTTTQVQLQQLYSEIGAEWERSQWNYLYDLFSVISLYDTVNRPAEPTGYNSALVLKLTMNILATTKPRHWGIIVLIYFS